MHIGEVSRRAGVPAKTIRYYEGIGLVPAAGRSDNGYRRYSEQDVKTLQFVQRARSLGFSVEDVGSLLGLWWDTSRHSADVKAMVGRQVSAIDRKIEELRGMRGTLINLAEHCHGDARPECPILDGLAN